MREAGSKTRLIVLSINRDQNTIRELFRSGADGYVLKDGPCVTFLTQLTTYATAENILTPLLRREEADNKDKKPDPLASLSRREYEVFSLLVDGVRPKDIAKSLEISPKTVDTYRASVMRKLEIEGVAGLGGSPLNEISTFRRVKSPIDMAKFFNILAASVGSGLVLGASIRLGEALGSKLKAGMPKSAGNGRNPFGLPNLPGAAIPILCFRRSSTGWTTFQGKDVAGVFTFRRVSRGEC